MAITPSLRRPLAWLALAATLATTLSAQSAPNVVILYADDMGFGDLGANNPASKIPTPHLDRLAAEGVRFTDGHSSSGICSPSRYALLTGRHHWRDFHSIVGPFGGPVFKPGQLTLPQMLRQKGYATAAIGKWHLGWDWNAIRRPGTPKDSLHAGDFDWSLPIPGGPLDHGFDTYFGDDVINFPPYAWIEGNRFPRAPDITLTSTQKGKQITRFPSGAAAPKEGTWGSRPGPALSDWNPHTVNPTLTQRTVDYILARQGQTTPFFLYVPFPSPHEPVIPQTEFRGRSQAGPYGDYVAETDAACGRILAALKQAGFAENTLVIFTADNGSEALAYARDQKFDHWSSAPFRGVKQDLYEGGHRVPFLMRRPGVLQPGRVSDALISQVDLMATLASLVGYALPSNAAEDSFDFLPYLRAETPVGPRRELVYNTQRDRYGCRDGDWVLIDAKTGDARPVPAAWSEKHRQPAEDDLPVELYNLKDDPGQRHNLAAAHPERVATMQARLKQLRVSPLP